MGARDVERLTAVVFAETDDVAILDRDVDVEPLLGEDREDMAAGQHKVGRLVTARDRHPVCVDDGDFSDMAEGPIGRSLKRVEDPRLLPWDRRVRAGPAPPLSAALRA